MEVRKSPETSRGELGAKGTEVEDRWHQWEDRQGIKTKPEESKSMEKYVTGGEETIIKAMEKIGKEIENICKKMEGMMEQIEQIRREWKEEKLAREEGKIKRNG